MVLPVKMKSRITKMLFWPTTKRFLPLRITAPPMYHQNSDRKIYVLNALELCKIKRLRKHVQKPEPEEDSKRSNCDAEGVTDIPQALDWRTNNFCTSERNAYREQWIFFFVFRGLIFLFLGEQKLLNTRGRATAQEKVNAGESLLQVTTCIAPNYPGLFCFLDLCLCHKIIWKFLIHREFKKILIGICNPLHLQQSMNSV